MEIIPVIDLRDGQAVLANGSARADYPRINTPLCPSCDPVQVADALIRTCTARRLYIADLNALMNAGNNMEAICAIAQSLPDIELWVDEGRRLPERCSVESAKTVYGTEVVGNNLTAQDRMSEEDILSLDFGADNGAHISASVAGMRAMPKRIICMDLDRVGRQQGFNLKRLEQLVQSYPDREIYIAGGIRNNTDLDRASRAGAAGALLATALHKLSVDPKLFRRG